MSRTLAAQSAAVTTQGAAARRAPHRLPQPLAARLLAILALAPVGLLAFAVQGCSADSTSAGSDASTDTRTDGDQDTGGDTEPECVDPDRDGWGPGCPLGEIDCQPSDPDSNPGATERCGDLLDNDCDGEVDEGCPCSEGRTEPCYDGPSGTVGVGICASGYRTCSGGAWSACTDQVRPRGDEELSCDGLDEDCDGEVDEGLGNACGACGPPPLEVCGDGLDNDCDGAIDEADAGCDCDGRVGIVCYSGPPQTLGVGRCRGGRADCDESGSVGACVGELLPITEVCDGLDNDCDGLVDEGLRNRCGVCGTTEPAEVCDGEDNDCDGLVDEGLRLACGLCPGEAGAEECGDGLDNDCDGAVDEQCPCVGEPSCYPGPPATRGVGACQAGTRSCDATGEFWGACTGFVLPSIEVCDGIDNDCDGRVDIGPRGCSVCGADPEVCDGVDNDCDGQIDEGVRNACGVCLDDVVPETECNGLDDDCDGLVDEGLTNACGTCGDSCYVAVWDEPAEWATGRFDGVDPTNTAEGLRLGAARSAFPDLWVANTQDGTVTRVDTDRATAVATYTVGRDPSRTAVDFDGHVFVANRAFDAQGTVSRVLARDCSGPACVAWTRDIGRLGDVPRGLAVDREGFAWVGTYYGRTLYRLRPSDGEIVGSWALPVPVYGLAIDSEGIIWISTIAATGIAAFDSNTNRYLGAWPVPDCGTPYGIAVDGVGNVWTGAWRCGGLVRLDRSQFDAGRVTVERFEHPNLVETRGVAVDGDGMVYVADSGTDRLAKFDPATREFLWTVPTCDEPIGVGVASDGNIWVVCRNSAETWRHGPDGTNISAVSTGRQPYSYSDMTGFQLRNFTAPAGTWTVLFDCGYAGCGFDSVAVDAAVPAGTAVRVRARTRPAAPADAAWSAWTPSIETNPADVGSLLPRGRFCEVEVSLTTTDRALTPVVTRVALEWQRP